MNISKKNYLKKFHDCFLLVKEIKQYRNTVKTEIRSIVSFLPLSL